MIKNIQELVQERIQEEFNPNDFAKEYSGRFMKSLQDIREIDSFDDSDEIDPIEFMEELKRMICEGDDELEIDFQNEGSIVLDVNIAKYMLANCTMEQITDAAQSKENMTSLMYQLFNEIEKV
jgi:hypothetical protein